MKSKEPPVLLLLLPATTHKAQSQLVLRLLNVFHVCVYLGLCICTYHVRNNYVTYIVAMQFYFSQLRQFGWLLCEATISSLPQLQVQDT